MCADLLSHVLTLCDSMNCSAPGSSAHGIFQQEFRSGLPFPTPEYLADPEIKPASPALAGRFFTTELIFSLNFYRSWLAMYEHLREETKS